MSELAGPIARIFLRYVGAALVTKAGLQIDVTDPDIMQLGEFALGLIISGTTEMWFVIAKRRGWRT